MNKRYHAFFYDIKQTIHCIDTSLLKNDLGLKEQLPVSIKHIKSVYSVYTKGPVRIRIAVSIIRLVFDTSLLKNDFGLSK